MCHVAHKEVMKIGCKKGRYGDLKDREMLF
jgi:hypothetical protein